MKIIPFLLVIITISKLVFAQTVPTDGLVAFYPFNGDASDASGNSFHGTVHGSFLTNDRFDNPDAAYYYDGVDDQITLLHEHAILGSDPSDFTISGWFNLQGSNPEDLYIFGDYGNWTDEKFGININISNVDHSVRTAIRGSMNQNYGVVSTSPILINEWNHFVSIYSESMSKIQLYINAELVGEDLFDTSIDYFADNSELMIGRHKSGGDFVGSIDDIRIYNYMLSVTEIESIYFEGGWNPTILHGLIADYPLNGDVLDESLNGKDGTPYGPEPNENRFNENNMAMSFDGIDDYIEIPTELISQLNEGSFSCWINISDLSEFNNIFSIGNTSSTNSKSELSIKPGGIISFFFRKNSSPPQYWYESSEGTLLENKWYHLVLTQDKSNGFHLYLNGEEINITYIPDGSPTGTEFFADFSRLPNIATFGARKTHLYNDGFFNGYMDDIKFYESVLTEIEVSTLYNEAGWPSSSNVSLEDYELNPTNPEVYANDIIIARFRITNHESTSVKIKLDVRFRSPDGVYGELLPYSFEVTVEPGTEWYERNCTIPENLKSGNYKIGYYLLRADNNKYITCSGYIDNGFIMKKLGPNPKLIVFPEEKLDFKTISVGNQNEKNISIQNLGSVPLEISSLEINNTFINSVDINHSVFMLSDTPELPLNISPGSSENLKIQFKPMASDEYSADLNIASNSEDESNYVVKLVGAGEFTDGPVLNVEELEIYSLNNQLEKIPFTAWTDSEVNLKIKNVGDSHFTGDLYFVLNFFDIPNVGDDMLDNGVEYCVQVVGFDKGKERGQGILNPDLNNVNLAPNQWNTFRMHFPDQNVFEFYKPFQLYNPTYIDKLVIEVCELIDDELIIYGSNEFIRGEDFEITNNNEDWKNLNFLSQFGGGFLSSYSPLFDIGNKANVIKNIWDNSSKWAYAKENNLEYDSRAYLMNVIGGVSWELFKSGASAGASQSGSLGSEQITMMNQTLHGVQMLQPSNLEKFAANSDYFSRAGVDAYQFFKEVFAENPGNLLTGSTLLLIDQTKGVKKSSSSLINSFSSLDLTFIWDTISDKSHFEFNHYDSTSLDVTILKSMEDSTVLRLEFNNVPQSPLSYNNIVISDTSTLYYLEIDFDNDNQIDTIIPAKYIIRNDLMAPNPVYNIKLFQSDGSSVELIWNANEEADLLGYKLYKTKIPDYPEQKDSIAFISEDTSFLDQNITYGLNYYWITAIDTNWNESFYSDPAYIYVESSNFKFYSSDSYLTVYPNPVSDNYTIQFSNPNHEKHELVIVNISGKIVKALNNIIDERIELDRDGLPSGLYLLELKGSNIYRGKIIIE